MSSQRIDWMEFQKQMNHNERTDRPIRFSRDRSLRILIVEDVEADAELIELELKRGNIPVVTQRVETREEFLDALDSFSPEVVLADYRLPYFSAPEALDILHQKQVDIPCILVTGSQSEEIAADCIKRGADDYILKQSLLRLPSAILHALEKQDAKRKRAKAEDALRRSQLELRTLAGHLQSVREDERARMSREIHDELGQTLTALKMDLLWLQGKIEATKGDSIHTLIQTTRSMANLIDSLIQTIRRISTDLRPRVLDDLGLIPAIEWQAHEFQTRMGIECKFTTTVEEIELDKERSTAVFRILQETLTNVARHAKATSVNIRFVMDDRTVILEIQDNGIGMQEKDLDNTKSLGLLGMRERALLFGGEVRFQGTPGSGTTVTLRLPLPRSLP
ncbi:MAG TPA: ATP-binding protein [Bacteroidota bacterium]